MPDLKRVFLDYDLGLLHIIAEVWGVDLQAPTQHEAAETLAAQLLHAELVVEMAQALPPEARLALEALRQAGGRLPLAQFTRQFGEVRAMGPAKRDREQPWRNQPTIAEMLWYRAFLARAFLADRGQVPQEFVFIPDDLSAQLPPRPVPAPGPMALGEPLAEAPASVPAAGAAPDEVTTLLAYLQIATVKLEGATFLPRHREALSRFLRWPAALDLWVHLVTRLGLAEGTPLRLEPTRARPYLEAERSAEALALATAWRDSKEWNDLLHVPGLIFEGGAWRNDPLATRQALLKLLADVPPNTWWPREAWVQAVKRASPDFQRPAGDYDSWYIRDANTKAYLRGFEHWDQVEGALVRWLLQGPLHWLGLVDLAATGDAFCITDFGRAVVTGGTATLTAASATIEILGDSTLRAPAGVSRYDRFQVARVCNWVAREAEGGYSYRLSPASLARAAQQGIRVSHILAFLQKAVGEAALPPNVVGALHRWERAGREASIKETVVLSVKSAELLDTLLRTPNVRRYLGDKLGPTAVEVRRADMARLREALAELGILAD